MEQPQQRSNSMVFVLVVSAVLLAVATFLTILLVTSRASPVEPGRIVQDLPMRVETVQVIGRDVAVVVNIDPQMEVMLNDETAVIQPPQDDPQQIIPTFTPTPSPIPPNPTPTITPIPRPNPVIITNYTVVPGDTLYSIATAHNTSVALMARHGVDAEDLIPGTTIGVAVPNPAYCDQGDPAYVVRDNDTVFSIALDFGTTAEAIAQENGLNNYRIDLAQVICIPR